MSLNTNLFEKGTKKMANEQVRNAKPSNLTVVTDKASPWYDPRSEWKPKDTLVESIKANGIVTPILAIQVDDTVVVIDGKQRVNAAKILETEGWKGTVPVLLREYDEALASSIRAISNNIRTENDFFTNLYEAKQLLTVHKLDFNTVGGIFGVTHQTIRNWMEIDKLPQQVKTAVQKNMVSATAAATLAKGAKKEDGTIDSAKVLNDLKSLASEAKASGDKKIKVSAASGKVNKSDRPSNGELKILAAREDTPEDFACFIRYVVGELDLKTAKSVARGKLDWLVRVTVDKAAKKAAKANNTAAKKQAKADKKKETEVTNDDFGDLFNS